MVTYVIKSLIHFKCHSRKDIITSFLLAFLEIKYNLSNTQREKYFIFLWPSFREIICRPWHLICVSDCVKFTSFSIIVETHVGVHLNWEIHNAGKNPGGEKSEKIEISIREEIENYSHDHVNKTVSLKKNNSYMNALEIWMFRSIQILSSQYDSLFIYIFLRSYV